MGRLGAIIRAVFHIDPDTLDEDKFFKLAGEAKYFLQLTGQVKWE